jgi:hypothetical protein
MNITEEQHVLESILAPTLVAAAPFESFRISKCAEDHVPDWNIREVVCVVLKLMMNPV